jgi:hypothetical protein
VRETVARARRYDSADYDRQGAANQKRAGQIGRPHLRRDGRRHVTACMQEVTNIQITARLSGRDLAAQGAPGGPARATVHTFLLFGVSEGAVPLMPPPCQVH